MRRQWQQALCVALGWVLGCGTLESSDHVHDLRILGVRADPPDQILTATQGAPITAPTQPVNVTALIADPNGNGRTLTYSFGVCTQLDTGTGAALAPPTMVSTSAATNRCAPADYEEFAHGTVVASRGWVELSGSFTAAGARLTQALALDDKHAIDGLRLPVQITVRAGAESIVGTKWVVYTLHGGPAYKPNENPVLQGVTVQGAPWVDGTPYSFSFASSPNAKGWKIEPIFDSTLQVAYQIPSYVGTFLDFNEIWLFDYFSSFGGFSPKTAGGKSFVSSAPTSPSSYWLPDKGTAGPATFWLVVRDGRGGENWLIREAVFGP